MWKQWKQCQTLFFWASKSPWTVTAAIKSKDASSLEEKLCPMLMGVIYNPYFLCIIYLGDQGIQSHHFMADRWGNWKTVADFILPKSLHMVTVAMKLKDTYSLEGKF